jgi:acyl-CoA synthetase (AMP-forming)/AMP-acid ligase II
VVDSVSSKEGQSLTSLWRAALADAGTFVIHQAIALDPNRNLSYTVSSALRAAMKIAVSFRTETKHPPGTRVAILSDGFGDLFPLYHAMWLLGMTVVAIPSNLSPKATAEHLNNVDAKVLVYSPAQMARLAKIIPHVSRLSHRLVWGELRAKESVAGSGGLSLQELLQNSERIGKLEDFADSADRTDAPALIVFTEGRYDESIGIEFSMKALLAAAENQSWAYFRNSNAERLVSLLPSKHVVSLIHTLLVPLVARFLTFDLSQCEGASRTWSLLDELVENQVTAVITDEHRIRDFFGVTKTNRISLPEGFRFLMLPTKPVTPEFVEPLKDLIVPCYGISEAGGIVSVGIKGMLPAAEQVSSQGEPTLAAGSPLGGLKVRILSRDGTVARGQGVGEILVQSDQVMSGYSAPGSGRTHFGPDGSLYTGDRGGWHFDSRGRTHIVVLGRESFFFRREHTEVNVFDLENVIMRVIGVKDVRIVPFPHELYGRELAAFVVVSTQHRGTVSREGLWRNLLQFFPWDVVPKVFMIADEKQIQTLPVRSILLEKLAPFSSVDFSKTPTL